MTERSDKKQAPKQSAADGLPDWAPDGPHPAFAVRIKQGVAPSPKPQEGPLIVRKRLSAEAYVEGVLAGDRTVLARAITLVESQAPQHRALAQSVLAGVLPHSGRSIRIGVSGLPGAGKSTLIENLGNRLVEGGHRVAVLAVDPSSTLTKGSILGDKTRMETLARSPACFIRPSPSGGTLGGVARKSRETILLCEAAGYDVILVETVGVGQSEVTVRSMVDFFMLVMIAGGGDELQGIKKGVMEIADTVVINKAEGENRLRAERSRSEYTLALALIQTPTRGWTPQVHLCSALTSEGVQDLWDLIETFARSTRANGVFEERRKGQSLDWFRSLLDEALRERFFSNPLIRERLPGVEATVAQGTTVIAQAVEGLMELFFGQKNLDG